MTPSVATPLGTTVLPDRTGPPLLPSGPMSGHPVLELYLGDVVRLRRAHPCGGRTWLVDRLGADIGIRCETCDRHVLVERAALERRVEGFVSRGDPVISAAVGPNRP